MVDIQEVNEEKKEVTLEEIIQQIMDRLARLEATAGYIIHTLEIKPPVKVEDADAGEHREEQSA